MARFRAFLTDADAESEAEETAQNATTATHSLEELPNISTTEDDSEEGLEI